MNVDRRNKAERPWYGRPACSALGGGLSLPIRVEMRDGTIDDILGFAQNRQFCPQILDLLLLLAR